MNIKISQKTNCNRCRAYYSCEPCTLGYKKKDMAYEKHGFTSFGVPLEPCPKPLTNRKYCYCVVNYKKRW